MKTPKPLVFPTLNLDAITNFKPIKIDAAFMDALQTIGRTVALAQANFGASMKPLLATLSEVFKDSRKADAVLKSGWVPFAGMPVDLIQDKDETDAIHDLIERFTRDEWPDIRSRLWQSVDTSGVDDEALATFDEALRAYDAGLYRSVVRLLFPEIERVARETVYGGSRREEPKEWQKKGNLNTGLKDFRETIMSKVPVGVATNATFGLALTEKMYDHLYKWVGETAESVEEFRADPVPNRHASQHGYVDYSSRQHAFNMLAMADFMFQLIMRTDAYIQEAAANGDNPSSEE